MSTTTPMVTDTPPPAAATPSPGAAAAKSPTYLEQISSKPAAPKPTPPAPAPAAQVETPATVPVPVAAKSPEVAAAAPGPTKTKRQRAEENWKVLDTIITESEQFEKGSEARTKVLEKLHLALRDISKRPRTGPARREFTTATEEWDDFLAPTCPLCSQFVDGGCSCEEHIHHADSFLAAGDDDEDIQDASAGASGGGGMPAAAAAH